MGKMTNISASVLSNIISEANKTPSIHHLCVNGCGLMTTVIVSSLLLMDVCLTWGFSLSAVRKGQWAGMSDRLDVQRKRARRLARTSMTTYFTLSPLPKKSHNPLCFPLLLPGYRQDWGRERSWWWIHLVCSVVGSPPTVGSAVKNSNREVLPVTELLFESLTQKCWPTTDTLSGGFFSFSLNL